MKTARTLLAGLSALSMLAAPAVAHAIGSPPQNAARSDTKLGASEDFLSTGGIVVGLLALTAIIAGIIAATSSHDTPTSP